MGLGMVIWCCVIVDIDVECRMDLGLCGFRDGKLVVWLKGVEGLGLEVY